MSRPAWDSSSTDSDTGTSPLDADGDGWDETEDCNDADARAFPGNAEVCDDGVDNDCNGYKDDWDQACLPDNGCATAPSHFGLAGILIALVFISRLRVASSRSSRPHAGPHPAPPRWNRAEIE